VSAFGTWAIFPQLREISRTIDLDDSHYLHSISECFVQSIRETIRDGQVLPLNVTGQQRH